MLVNYAKLTEEGKNVDDLLEECKQELFQMKQKGDSMKHCQAYVIIEEEYKKITGETPLFKDGFLMSIGDCWDKLERYINKPIMSVRPSGRQEWKDLIILAAPGYINEESGKRIIEAPYTYCVEFLQNVHMEKLCMEFYKSKCNMLGLFSKYEFPSLSEHEFETLVRWVHDVHKYE